MRYYHHTSLLCKVHSGGASAQYSSAHTNPPCVLQVPLLVPHLAAVLAACLYTLALQRPVASKARHT